MSQTTTTVDKKDQKVEAQPKSALKNEETIKKATTKHKAKSAQKSFRLSDTNSKYQRDSYDITVTKPTELKRQNPHRRSHGQTYLGSGQIYGGPPSPMNQNLNLSRQKMMVYNFDQPKAMFYTPLFSEKKKTQLLTPSSVTKTKDTNSRQQKLNDFEIRNQFFKRQMQSYYEKKGGLIKGSIDLGENERILATRQDRMSENISPATYSPQKDVVLNKAPEWTIGQKQYNDDVFKTGVPGPGTYEAGKPFGADAIAVAIRDPSSPSRDNEIPGPGAYEHERGESQTKHRQPAWELGARNQLPLHTDSPGSGHYQYCNEFGQDSVKYSINARHEDRIASTPGPGYYEPTQADTLIHCNCREVQIMPEHHSCLRNSPSSMGPGSYNMERPFGSQSVSVTIQQRRDSPLRYSVGPGQYNPEQADRLKMSVAPIYTMGSCRKSTEYDPNGGPGQYNPTKPFAHDTKSFIIGEFREQAIPVTVGPGEYDHSRSDNITHTKSREVQIMPEQAHCMQSTIGGSSPGPGEYNQQIEFGVHLNKVTFGVRREEKADWRVGPGHYNPELAEFQVHQNSRQVDFGAMPKRFYTEEQMAIGPGSYNAEPKFGDDTRNITIGVGWRQLPRDEVPGPGEYQFERADNLVRNCENLALDFSRQQERFMLQKDQNLGPGSYDLHQNFGDEAIGGYIYEKREIQIASGPGPGTYSPERADQLTKSKSVAVDFTKLSERPQMPNQTPLGPGTYDVYQNFGDEMKGGFMYEKREQIIASGPGPGTYSPERADDITKSKSVAVDFTKLSERPQMPNQTPLGPGTYDVHQNFGEEMKGGFMYERREQIIASGPGPGTYSPERADDITKAKSIAVDFTKLSERLKMPNETPLGPGTYEVHQNFGEEMKGGFMFEKREVNIPYGPGPGSYSPERADVITKTKSIQVDFTKLSERLKMPNETPLGPGTYEVHQNFGEEINGGFMYEKRDKKMASGPGPGSYSPERADQITKTSSAVVYFTKQSQRPSLPNETPLGPGTYEDHYHFGDESKGFSIGIKREEKIAVGPGPGCYSPERGDKLIRTKAQEQSFVNQTGRKDFVGDVKVGPGSYQTFDNFGVNTGQFTIGVKRDVQIISSVGPGTYQPDKADELVNNRSPSVKFGNQTERKNQLNGDVNLGPGSYNYPSSFDQLKKMTIMERRPEVIESSPGPADYNPEQADMQTKQREPEANFSKGPIRFTNMEGSNLGPGTYRHSSSFDHLPMMTIQQKRASKIEQSPGPCDYRPEKAEPIVKPREAAADFAKGSHRLNSISNSEVGPGFYNVKDSFAGNLGANTIQQRREQKIQNSVGPGAYSPEHCDQIVKPSTRVVNFINSTGRKQVQGDSNIGPGTYKHTSSFDNLPAMTIIEKRTSKTARSPGPGEYNPEVAESITKPRDRTPDFSKGPGRKTSISDSNIGPGSYNSINKFGESLGKVTIGQRRDYQQENRIGPGTYSPEHGDSIVNVNPRVVNFINQTGRKQVEGDFNLGPGTYKHSSSFENLPMMTIQEKRDNKIARSPGPGEYNPELADKLTKTQSAQINVYSRSGRKDVQENPNNGPGCYNVDFNFGLDLNRMTIGTRAESKTSLTVGPGSYSPEKADPIVKSRASHADFKKQTPRKTQSDSNELGPGHYNIQTNFGADSAGRTIGVRLRDQVPITVGPGTYDPQESVTKQRVPSAIIPSSPSRFALNKNQHNAESYGALPSFANGAKSFTIGVRRNDSVSHSVGPGTYDPQDSITKIRPVSAVIPASPTRFVAQKYDHESIGQGSLPNFTDGSKSFTIGVRRPGQKNEYTPGPGFYDPASAERLTKASSPARTISKNSCISASRSNQNLFKKRQSIGFLNNSYHTIGTSKSVTKLNKSMICKNQTNGNEVFVATQTKKPSSAMSFAKTKTNQKAGQQLVGPGYYEIKRDFFANLKPVTSQPRRDPKQDLSPGPGYYKPESAVKAIQLSSPSKIIAHKTTVKTPNKSLIGPGSYEIQSKLNKEPTQYNMHMQHILVYQKGKTPSMTPKRK